MNGPVRSRCPRTTIPVSIGRLAAALLCVLVAPLGARAQSRYAIIDLGTFGGTESIAYGVNDSGQVSGTARAPGDATSFPFLYSGGVLSNLGTVTGGSYAFGMHLNAGGDVVGYADGVSNGTYFAVHAFRYHAGQMIDLGTLGGLNSLAHDVNDQGDVVGYAALSTFGDSHAFLYRAGAGAMQDLGTLGGKTSEAFGINNAGQIVGESDAGAQGNLIPRHAFLYGGGTMQDLGTLGGITSSARGVNDSGQIVGYADLDASATHAFLYENGVMKDLGALPGGTVSGAAAVNNAGVVVGASATAGDAGGHAFVYSSGTMRDLNAAIDPALGWTLLAAEDINGQGQIVGSGTIGGETHGFLLTPLAAAAPEPGTGALLYLALPPALGLVAAPTFRRGRPKKQGEAA